MRLANGAHETRPWVIAEIAPDFDLLDVWALPVHGGRDGFDEFLDAMATVDPTRAGSTLSRALFWVRLRLGSLLGWDDAKPRPIPGCTETTLAARLPDGLRGSADDVAFNAGMREAARGFTPLYRTNDEFAAEISNETVHGVLHLGWVEALDGRYRAQMGVYVKPRGRLGGIYMKLIEPFRHLIVYPALMRHIGRAWERRDVARPTT